MPNNTTARKSTATKAAKVEGAKDWTYLASKVATDLHEDMTAWILEEAGIDLDEYADDPQGLALKMVQCTAVLRMVYQRSDRNKARESYKALDTAVVEQRSTHMVQAHADAKAAIAARMEAAEAKVAARKAAAAKRRTAKKTA